jgi:predicted nucleotidyltransferase component of viral defense system
MLHLFTLNDQTFQLLKVISAVPFVQENFALAGGTALALQIGHRASIDLDFFSRTAFDVKELEIILTSQSNFQFNYSNNNSRMLFGFADQVKCDFIHEPAKQINPFILEDGIHFFSIEDIAAMKLHTICGRGKKKDFFDTYCLLQKYSWDELIHLFISKYNETQLPFLWRSILHFEDAENDPDIKGMAPYEVSWEEIKSYILKTCLGR